MSQLNAIFCKLLTHISVVYYYCGSYVSSPALGSAGVLLKKIAYGFSLPGLIVTTTLCLHLPAKYIFVRALRGSEALVDNSFKHWAIWIACTLGNTIISYIIASAIPVFGGLVSLIGALLGTLMSFHPGSIMCKFLRLSRSTKLTIVQGSTIIGAHQEPQDGT